MFFSVWGVVERVLDLDLGNFVISIYVVLGRLCYEFFEIRFSYV